MADLVIPTRFDLPSYEYQLELEGTLYTFTFNYNRRLDRWFMNIGDEVNNPIVSGIKIIVNYDLLDRYKNSKLPPGQFIAIDESGENKTPGREDLGNDVKLFYIESA